MHHHKCPECGRAMALVRVLPALHDMPTLAAFYCRPCEFADTIPVKLDPSVVQDSARTS